MFKVKHTYEYSLDKITFDQMVVKLGMSAEEAATILNYRERFALLEGEDKAKVNLSDLWEALDQPYTKFSVWLVQVVEPFAKSLQVEISSYREKRKGRYGQPKVNHFIDTETAKHIALMANSEAGFQIRNYFITVEKLFNSMVKHNALRVDIHGTEKQFHSMTMRKHNFNMPKALSDRIQFNTIVKRAVGARNELSTDLDYYAACQLVVGNALLNGKNPEVLKSALN